MRKGFPLSNDTAIVLPRRVIVASQNPVKVRAAEDAIRRSFPSLSIKVTGVPSSSDVSDQPFGDEETLQGARNRLIKLCNNLKKSDAHDVYADDGPWDRTSQTLIVAIEGGVGVRPHDQRMECFAWVAVGTTGEPPGAISVARSASFILPLALEELVLGGMELGAADDKFFARKASGSGSGTVGRLTNGLCTRTLFYEQAVQLALIPMLNPDLYGSDYEWGPPLIM